jgi:hypothetical protein
MDHAVTRCSGTNCSQIVHGLGRRSRSRAWRYNTNMKIAPGKVVDGRVQLDVELPDGTIVTVLALEGDETFEVDAETETMLA